MPVGRWTIDASVVEQAAALCPEYLPTGTVIDLALDGVGRSGFEAGTDNELEGRMTLLPPLVQPLCATKLGQWTRAGRNLCGRSDNKLREAASPFEFPASFTFWRLADEPSDIFFTELGAKKGSGMVLITIPHKTVEWQLWLRSQNELVAQCVGGPRGAGSPGSYPIYWRRVQ